MKAKTVYDTAFGLKGRTVFAANRSPEQQPSPGSHLNRS